MIKCFFVFFVLLLVVFSVFVFLQVFVQEVQLFDCIVVVVDEDVILQSEFQCVIVNIKVQYVGCENQLLLEDVFSCQVFECLVLVKLQVVCVQGSGICVSDQELNQVMNVIVQQNGLNLDVLCQCLVQDGIDFNDFCVLVCDEIIVQCLCQSFVQSCISVSEGEVDVVLKQQVMVGNQYYLVYILIVLFDGVNVDQIVIGQKKVDGVKVLLDKGELDFNVVVVCYLDSLNVLEGGDLGWCSLDEILQVFVQLMEKMKLGEVVGLIRGLSGFQLLKLVEVCDSSFVVGEQMVIEFYGCYILVCVDDYQIDVVVKVKIDILCVCIVGGVDFQIVVREFFEDNNSKGQGGDFGWFLVDVFGLVFGQQVSGLQDGGVSQLFCIDVGWYIVQCVVICQIDVIIDNQCVQVCEIIGCCKLEDEYNCFLQELCGEVYVSFCSGDCVENIVILLQF